MTDWTTVASVSITALLGAWAIWAQRKQAESGWAQQRALVWEARQQERRADLYVELLAELGRWMAIRERESGMTSLPPLTIRDHEETLLFSSRLAAFGSKEINGLWNEWIRVGASYEALRKAPKSTSATLRAALDSLAAVVRRIRNRVVEELQSEPFRVHRRP